MGFGLDPPIQVAVVPTLLEGNRVERILVIGVAMADVGPRRERRALLDGELTSPSDATAAHDGSTHGRVLGDRLGEGCVFGCEVQKDSDRGGKLSAVAFLGVGAVLGAHHTPTFALRGGPSGARR